MASDVTHISKNFEEHTSQKNQKQLTVKVFEIV